MSKGLLILKIVESIKYVDKVIKEENWEQKRKNISLNNINIFVMGEDWVRKFHDFTSGGALNTVYLMTFVINIMIVLSLFNVIHPDVWLYYLSIHFYQAWSLYGFVRLMIYR